MQARVPGGLLVVLVVLGVLGAACGGSGNDAFSGDPVVPDGYATYRGHGVSLVHPEGWTVDDSTTASGATQLVFRSPDAQTGAVAGIDVTLSTNLSSFEDALEDRREISSNLNNAELSEPERVDVPGAQRAELTELRFAGEDVPRAEARSLAVRVSDEVGVFLSTRVPVDARQTLDVDAVVESFRLTGEPVTGASGSPTL